MSELARRDCIPCRGGIPPLTPAEIQPLAAQLEGWQVVDNHHLFKRYETKNFAESLAQANRIAAIAEAQNHHPDLLVACGRLDVTIFTHKIDGLTESDFILAAKCDQHGDGPQSSS